GPESSQNEQCRSRLLSIPQVFATWVRLAGVLAAVLFVVVATRIFWGEQLLPTSTPLPFFAYPFLVLTFVGWMVPLVKGEGVVTSSPRAEQPNQALHPSAPREGPRNPTRP